MPRCLRCADAFEPRRRDDVHCLPCVREVAAIIAADEVRRSRIVWSRPADLTPWSGQQTRQAEAA